RICPFPTPEGPLRGRKPQWRSARGFCTRVVAAPAPDTPRGVPLRHLALAALALALLPLAARNQAPTTLRVTGTVFLLKGQKIPQNSIVQVRIYFHQEGVCRVTSCSRIGTLTCQVLDPSRPLEFSVEVNKSCPDKHGPGEFLMKAYVFIKDGQK